MYSFYIRAVKFHRIVPHNTYFLHMSIYFNPYIYFFYKPYLEVDIRMPFGTLILSIKIILII